VIERMTKMLGVAAAAAAVAVVGGCAPVGVTAQLGYAQTEIHGTLALDESGGSGAIEQDIESAFGLGSPSGSPYLRGQADFDGPVVTASAFWLRDSGRGQLDTDFGGLPANTPVAANLDLAVIKVAAAYDFDLGPVTLAPGVLADVFALDFSAAETTLGNREEIDDIVFVPMPFLRAAAAIGSFAVIADVAWIEVSDLGDASGRFFDVEGIVDWSVSPHAHVFAGYRVVDIDGSGDAGAQAFAADLQIRGWFLGGGLRF
jgi:hypothetical protein